MSYFDGIIGQRHIITRLKALHDGGMMPHGFLFHGDPGSGKLKTAIALASLIIGRQVFSPDEGKSYLDKVAAVRIEDGESEKKVSEDILPVYTDGGAFWLRRTGAGLKLEQWHTLVRNYLRLASDEPRVVIVEDFHTANAYTANAMLKTIEEPPAGVHFILITEMRATVLPTVVSRCTEISFGPVPAKDIEVGLTAEGYEKSERMHAAIAASGGNPGLARRLMNEEASPMFERAVGIMRALSGKTGAFAAASLMTETLSREETAEVYTYMRGLARDMLAIRCGASDNLLAYPQRRDVTAELLPRWSVHALKTLQEETLNGEDALRLNVKAALVSGGTCLNIRRAIMEGRS